MGGYAAPAVTDIDGDGLLDLFIGNSNGTVYRYEQTQSAAVPTLTVPLPVVLTAFTGQASGAGNQLNWATAQEVTALGFRGRGFGRRSCVCRRGRAGRRLAPAAAPAATVPRRSATAQSAARRYYRLRQVDL